MIIRRHILSLLGAGALLGVGVLPVTAQDFPSKPIRVVVPVPAGNGADIIVRLVADQIERDTGVNIVVENKPGGNAIIGSSEVARAAPDGYTVLSAGTTAFSAAAAMNATPPYDPVADFSGVTGFALNSTVLVVRPEFEANSLQELIEMARAEPGKYSYGSGNQSGRMAAELFRLMTEVDLLHVPYQGTQQATTDLLNGQVTMMFNGILSSTPHLTQGTMKGLGVSSQEREPNFPDIPAIDETVPGYSFVAWQGFAVPKGTSPEVVAKLNEMFVNALNAPEIRARLESQGLTVWTTTPAEMDEAVAADVAKWKDLVQQAGIEVNP